MPTMDRLEWECDFNLAPIKTITFIHAKRLIDQWRLSFLAHIWNTSIEVRPIELVYMVCEFPEVFLTNFPSKPLDREIDFYIHLETNTHSIYCTHYTIVPVELKS